MAKGQKRGNREAKKPKQEKKAPAAEPSSLTTRLRESQARTEGKKK
jgi:hypothetical protein